MTWNEWLLLAGLVLIVGSLLIEVRRAWLAWKDRDGW